MIATKAPVQKYHKQGQNQSQNQKEKEGQYVRMPFPKRQNQSSTSLLSEDEDGEDEGDGLEMEDEGDDDDEGVDDDLDDDDNDGDDGPGHVAPEFPTPPTAAAAVGASGGSGPSASADNRPDLPRLVDFLEHRDVVNGTRKGAKPAFRTSPGLYLKVGTSSQVVRNAFRYSGYHVTRGNGRRFHSYWGAHLKKESFSNMGSYQRINHFPGTFEIGRKDRLYRNLARMKRHHGASGFSFFPQTWVLPQDWEELKRDFGARGGGTLIVKPPASARGQGIKVISELSQIPKRKTALIQRYLDDPYLIDGFKFDLRIYVLVTSFDPLRVYVYEDGLVRFCTEKYRRGAKYANHKMMHLTNYSVQKKADEYVENKDAREDGAGSKWSVKALKRWFAERGVSDGALWTGIHDIIIKTLLSVEDAVNTNLKMYARGNPRLCYELFGFDIFVDRQLKPWVLEVNISPSLESSSPLDRFIKGNLCCDMFQMLCFREYDRDQVDHEEAQRARDRLQGLGGSGGSLPSRTPGGALPPGAVFNLAALSPDELKVVKESDLEFRRRGEFKRIFPADSPQDQRAMTRYDQYFAFPRHSNALLASWARAGSPMVM
jgi:hypothetical protein